MLAEYDGTSTLTTQYVYAGPKRLAMVGSTTQYYLTDHLGDTRVLLKSDGTIPTTYDYWPYGAILLQGGTDGTRFKFTGHERDGESGLDNMLARMCASDDGRFLRPDPKDFPAWSPYVYAFANPLRYFDPDGKSGKDVVKKARQYIGNLYELGGKQPLVPRSIPKSMDPDLALAIVLHSGDRTPSGAYVTRANNEMYKNLGIAWFFSIGIDCSGLACTAFNADPDKLMSNFNIWEDNLIVRSKIR